MGLRSAGVAWGFGPLFVLGGVAVGLVVGCGDYVGFIVRKCHVAFEAAGADIGQ
jgi:hypothetical protein